MMRLTRLNTDLSSLSLPWLSRGRRNFLTLVISEIRAGDVAILKSDSAFLYAETLAARLICTVPVTAATHNAANGYASVGPHAEEKAKHEENDEA